ncbi:MAG: hypothetical protein P1Q69_16415 [Candidatus Thorarchaeota archaeon]|nr:hypothetical protein [Candidatus Thorarchaeota archaeon]
MLHKLDMFPLVLLLLALTIFPHEGITEFRPLQDQKYTSNPEVRAVELLPDPYLDSEPHMTIAGVRTEFSSNYCPGSANQDSNIDLIWTHTPGSWIEEYDLVFFTQSFSWVEDLLPAFIEVRLNMAVLRTGDFESEGTQDMFRICVWLIDTSGFWTPIYESNDAIKSSFNEVAMSYSWIDWQVWESFGGLTENIDPEDTLEIAIGLKPVWIEPDFDSGNQQSQSWNNYNGTVTARIKSVNLYNFWDIPNNAANHLFSLDYSFWSSQEGDILPNSSTASIENYDRCYDIETAPNGGVYLVGEIESNYLSDTWFEFELLQKYDSDLNLEWSERNSNLTIGRALTYHNGAIYTVSHRALLDDLLITKWTDSGEKA